jgi:hypothetical protein
MDSLRFEQIRNCLKLSNRKLELFAIGGQEDQTYFLDSETRLFCGEKLVVEIPTSGEKAVGLFYHQGDDKVFLVLETGHIYSYSLSVGEEELVGIVDEGILAVAPSPDGELVAIVSGESNGNSSLLLMTNEFDVVSQVPIEDDSVSNQFVSVGWVS